MRFRRLQLKHRKSNLIVFLCLAFFLVSCQIQANNVSKTLPVSRTPVRAQVTKVLDTTQPTDQAATATIKANPEPLILKDLVFSPCLAISPRPPEGKDLGADLLVARYLSFSVLNLRTGLKTTMNRPGIVPPRYFFVSPDGKWFAYEATQQGISSTWVVIEPAENAMKYDPQKIIEWGKSDNPIHLEGWFSNEALVITQKNKPDTFFSTLIVNPFTGKKDAFLLEDLPNFKFFKSGGVGLYHFPGSNLMPDPTLKKVVYPEFVEGHDYISLWDIETRKPLARIEDLYAFRGDPLWAQDGSNFLVTASTKFANNQAIFDWFQVTQSGVITQQTHFANFLQENVISNASRSVDGRYLAFQMKYKDALQEKVRYYIWDLKAESLEGFCVESLATPSSITEKRPVWSPDSQYVVISNTDDNDDGVLILVDLRARHAYQISEDVHVRGWLVTP